MAVLQTAHRLTPSLLYLHINSARKQTTSLNVEIKKAVLIAHDGILKEKEKKYICTYKNKESSLCFFM